MINVLVVDDSALMRKRLCDIITQEPQFSVKGTAGDIRSAKELLMQKSFDCIVMNVYLGDWSGIDLIQKFCSKNTMIPVIAISSAVREDREVTVRALEAGAVEVVVRPFRFNDAAEADRFKRSLLRALRAVSSRNRSYAQTGGIKRNGIKETKRNMISSFSLVALACSTGGPQALNRMIPMLPPHLGVPVVVVQHMPAGFTASLADRIDSESRVRVREAMDGELLLPDCVYIAPGGRHFEVSEDGNRHLKACVYDGPPVHNLRPCADVMYESLCRVSCDNILCVVLTGMGSDGTEGISQLKKCKNIYTITQDEDSCVVYGMPRSVKERGLSDETVPITEIARAISKELGV
ncbi:MAG: chemotaxis-specific protein-glutamate methyltransferase CheB [Lachnospiraceae bacterium]|nr:chemotaxis-specific protein-glutamate methyltransferase CheB [Lachnospiraceae bacterium]